MFAWLRGHETVLWWLGALSVVTFVGTLVALPLVVARLPPDYFTHAQRPVHRRHAQATGARLLGRLGKNLLGVLMVLVGVAMLLLPGQGILTILIGLMLLDFPGKRGLERRLVQQPAVWRAINWMRAKAHQPALELPDHQAGVPASPPALRGHDTLRAGDAHRADANVSRARQAGDAPGVCRVEHGDAAGAFSTSTVTVRCASVRHPHQPR